MTTVYFTICAKNYLSIARTCLHSIQDTDPDCKAFLILCDEVGSDFDPSLERFDVIPVEALGLPDFADMALRYDVMELSTAIKPFVFSYMFQAGWDKVIYCDPDLLFLRRLDHVLGALETGQEAVLTPHICAPIEDDRQPGDQSMLQVGVYNLGFLALRKSVETVRFAAWWGDKLRDGAVVDLPNGLFTDQKWCDLLPCLVENTLILRHPGYNLAYWNLMHRPVRRSGRQWTAAGQPLHFVHFSGPSFDDPRVFSKHQDRFDTSQIGPLVELYEDYKKTVRSNDFERTRKLKYRFDSDVQGLPIPRLLRQLYRKTWPVDRSVTASSASLQDRLDQAITLANAPASLGSGTSDPRVTNIMHLVWQHRPDLQAAFNLAEAAGREAFAHWFIGNGWRECSLDERFLKPVQRVVLGEVVPPPVVPAAGQPEAVDGPQRTPSEVQPGSSPVPSQDWAIQLALATRRVLGPTFQALPTGIRNRARAWVQRRALRHEARVRALNVAQGHGQRDHQLAEAPISLASLPSAGTGWAPLPRLTDVAEPGATLIGYSNAELGMGEHVRMTAAALATQTVAFGIYNVSLNVVARQSDRRFDNLLIEDNRYKANILHINADQLGLVMDHMGHDFFKGRYNIAYPAWELAIWPDAWVDALEQVDEVWAPSEFVRDAIAAKVRKPVHIMPLAVELAEGYQRWQRRDFGIPDDAYVFLFNFDLASMFGRKNPGAIIKAYQQAFGLRPNVGPRRPVLVIKVLSADLVPGGLAQLEAMVEADPSVIILSETYTPDKVHGLVNVCDCFVSLHRSEGFGRGPAEAMRLGKPVIGTDYGGVRDFMKPTNSFPVSYGLIPVQPHEYPHAENQVWADPSIFHAAQLMTDLAADPELGLRIGSVAQADMIRNHSRAAIGKAVVDHLRKLGVV